jgi:hypothetical protein
MKKQKLLVILISIIVIQTVILSVLLIQTLSSNNSNDLSNETQETEQVTFETLSNNITLLITGSRVNDGTWTKFFVDIENKNSESIKYISGTILYYDEQNQLLHTLGFEHDTLIPGNFTRTKALYLSIPSNVQRVYTRYEVIFDDIELS